MRTINITVRDKLPVVAAMSGTAVQDNKYKLLFDFDEEWQDGMKSVVVVGNRRQYVVYPTETNEVEIELGDARVVNVGVMQDVIATSRPCQIIVEESIKRRMGVEIVPPSDDMWTYITEQIRLLNAAKLSPVVKSDAMTQPVGRDAQGRLFTAPSAAGGNTVTDVSLTTSSGPDGPYRVLRITLGDGTVLKTDFPPFAVVSDVVVIHDFDPTSTHTGDTDVADAGSLGGWLSPFIGRIWVNRKTQRIFVLTDKGFDASTGYYFTWTPVGGGLPEFTDADEGNVLQIVGGKPVWVALQSVTVEEITLTINDDGSVAVSGVELAVQDNGAVLVGGAELALLDDGAVLVR